MRRVIERAILVGLMLLIIAILLPDQRYPISPVRLAVAATPTPAVCDDANGKPLPAGDAGTDLVVTGPCRVKAGSYTFRNVNIYATDPTTCAGNPASCGSLNFDDDPNGIDFSAESIVIENGGSLIAGSKDAPIGSTCSGGKCGTVNIHLWGAQSDPGANCKADTKNQCGVPDTIWTSNTMSAMNPTQCTLVQNLTPPQFLPGGVNDCFYQYEALDPADQTAHNPAYFGHKVLALSYGGTLQLFGKKGATYAGKELSTCKETDAFCSGTSWVRLKGSLKANATSMTVDGAVDWKDKDHIIITTTDYLPGHTEELVINGDPVVNNGVTTVNFTNADGVTTGVKWPHNGQAIDVSPTAYPDIARLKLNITTAETRAAVGLLTRSITIDSRGDTPTTTFPAEPTDGSVGYFYGGHTIVRQGFQSYQVQGVAFHQLGQGGAIMHYPVHLHMARQVSPAKNPDNTPRDTFVKDSSIWDSMTRWITVHATQGVLLARNVGFKSIGHGYYLEDGTETDNKLYSNLGAFARAAVDNAQNKRLIPGILTENDPPCDGTQPKCSLGYDGFPFYSDANHPAVFWITNGWNDFEYNQASGAGTCGACYWFVPAAISGPSRKEKWFGYAGEQRSVLAPLYFERAGTTPLETFVGNSCTSAMSAFQEVGNSSVCNGVNFITTGIKPDTTLRMLPSDQAKANFINPFDPKDPRRATTTYWPIVGGGGRLATRCPDADKGTPFADCSNDAKAAVCAQGNTANCDVTVLDKFTTSFNWAQKNFAAIWMRPFWSLIINSVITDPQAAGVNFVTSGDYSKASVIDGFWALARKSVFIGSSQWQNSKNDLSDNPLASNAGPFNPFVSKDKKVTGLKCAVDPFSGGFNPSYCMSKDEGIAMQLEAFTNFQRMFSVYDGPAYQDSNAYLNIVPTYVTTDGTVTGDIIQGCKPNVCPDTAPDCNPCANVGFKDTFLPGVRADQKNGRCYLPNAAIGWKQSNGFYYSPAFHSVNLFFDNVKIRHFVTEPLFKPGLLEFNTDRKRTNDDYCQWTNNFFDNFTDIDRETVLNDDDGTLTGLTSPVNKPVKGKSETFSINKEDFFDAPTETPECASDLALNKTSDPRCAPNTAKTSPYEYVSTVVYPECALTAAPPTQEQPLSICKDNDNKQFWGSACSSQPGGDPILGCVGVPLFRQLLVSGEKVGLNQMKRMMGQNTFQRSGLTVNNGVYYIDTTVSRNSQQAAKAPSLSVFTAGQKFDLFFLYANKNTAQTYQMFVGKGIPDTAGGDFAKTNVKFGYVDITTNSYKFSLATPKGKKLGDLPDGWGASYNKGTGILTLNTNMLSLADDFDLSKIAPGSKPPKQLGAERCQPANFCTWDKKNSVCGCNPKSPYFDLCSQQNNLGQTICDWSVKDIDCPAAGCPSFQVTFPDEKYFKATDQDARPTPTNFDFAPPASAAAGFNWTIGFNLEDKSISGSDCNYTSQPPLASCTATSSRKRRRGNQPNN